MNPCKRPCPKCGNMDIHRKFYPKDAVIFVATGNDNPVDDTYIFEKHLAAWSKRDHIEHRCRVCSFEWRTEPLKTKD